MGTLSAQIAHVVHIGEEAQTISVRSWSPEYLTGTVIPWTQHVDLLWPTIDRETQRKVLNQVQHLLKQKLRYTARRSDLQKMLGPADSGGCGDATMSCQKAILARIVSNAHTRDSVRIAALQHYADALRGGMGAVGATTGESKRRDTEACTRVSSEISSALQPMRVRQAIAEINGVLARELQETAKERSAVSVDGERRQMEAAYLQEPQEMESLSLGLALLDMAPDEEEERVMLVQQFLNHNPHTGSSTTKRTPGLIYNAALAAALHAYEENAEYRKTENGRRGNPKMAAGQQLRRQLLGEAILREFTMRILLPPNVDDKLCALLPIHPLVLAKLASYNEAFLRTYMMQLTQLNKRCQVAMLREHIDYRGNIPAACDALASDDTTVARIAEMWTQLFVHPRCASSVKEALDRDRSHFNILARSPRPRANLDVFGAIVEFWTTFYAQFLQERPEA
ncbi:hypothetical protein GQ54DRAFT_297077 [Martensiomyces pterosporus]|nr:hypothetical protein GQ54DRAFT_297077 [Martensiomyces pterosporus]